MNQDQQAVTSHAERVSRGRQRRFTSQQKLAILREWERTGNGAEVARVHGIPAARLYRCKRQLEHGADEYLRSGRPKKDAELRELERLPRLNSLRSRRLHMSRGAFTIR